MLSPASRGGGGSLSAGSGGRGVSTGWDGWPRSVALAYVLAGLLAASAPRVLACEEHTPDSAEEAAADTAGTMRVIAGRPGYDRSAYFKFHFGEGYRKLWTSPFEAN